WKVLIGHPDVVIAGEGERVDRLLLLLICRLLGIRILWFEGGVPYIDETKIREYVRHGRMNRWFGRYNPRSWLARKANGLIAYSEHARQYYLAAGFPAGAIWVAPNAPDTEALAGYRAVWLQRSRELEAERRRFAPSGQKILFLLGRLNSARRVDMLLDAMRCLKDRGLAPSLVIVGDGSERQRLSDMAAHLGLDHVFFEGAIYDDLTLSKYFMVSDIFVNPALSSLAIKMAMAFGRPVITGDVGLEVHDVQDGVNGFILPAEHPEVLVERLQLLLESDDLRARMGENGSIVIRDQINIGRMIDGFRRAIFAESPQSAIGLNAGGSRPHRP
ncbi:MAG: glycosyltransferase, partial [Leptospirales bacterium]